eukprot:TRINITY_DN7795_c0_g3_i4.p1 TRINITY_DN7795_c0_g3~~TRINITY_DN7795_c0_g3_i4.p1  ORF type:complete len:227 (-),score=73.60 TRINITY_DN7795_c0_g3_i4:389-1069(-)
MPPLQPMFCIYTFNEYFLDQLIDFIGEGNQQVKVEAAWAFCQFLRGNQSHKKRESILATVTKLKNSKSYYERLGFLEFATAAANNFSTNFLKTQGILDGVIKLGGDKALTMRIRVARRIIQVACKVKKDVQSSLLEVVNALRKDPNKDVKEEAAKTLKELEKIMGDEERQKEIEAQDLIKETDENLIMETVLRLLMSVGERGEEINNKPCDSPAVWEFSEAIEKEL